ncbi:MAG: hypothetical protein A3D31_11315 [Candidatus Fluviicola riflensis]|nr:MAG: hypothetical protein CHH17_15740 [Candidatus Fluviicola riflensis]OGS77578.1 MAG: hypothetical protein A3D31_11315 [Candidatus Fluviicola riflensis]OGS84159.1 MAG: hypothetical protein A3E30_12715 [Fluviicola sp. RIFCSPHIGHO2_12_FULL_43_24]OGS84644.1 MAG: hypothetical protein A2724_08250 [Fluviicola sp. RIFCSPHIGHO2_01_FULL_43_53]
MRVDPSKIIPTSDETSEQWIVFHKALKSWFGKKEANSFWLRFWNQRAGAGTDPDTRSLRTYMESQDVDLTTDWKGNTQDAVLDVVDWLGDTANVIRLVVIGTVIIGVGLVTYYVIKKTNQGSNSRGMIRDFPVKPFSPRTAVPSHSLQLLS